MNCVPLICSLAKFFAESPHHNKLMGLYRVLLIYLLSDQILHATLSLEFYHMGSHANIFLYFVIYCCKLVWLDTRGVPRLDGARGKKDVWTPMLEPKVFRKQMYCNKESTCDIVGTFRRPPQWFGAQGIVFPYPLVTTLPDTENNSIIFQPIVSLLLVCVPFLTRKLITIFSSFIRNSFFTLFNLKKSKQVAKMKRWKDVHKLWHNICLKASCLEESLQRCMKVSKVFPVKTSKKVGRATPAWCRLVATEFFSAQENLF